MKKNDGGRTIDQPGRAKEGMQVGGSMEHWSNKAHKNAGWIVVLGIAQIVLGFMVLAAPLSGGVAVTMIIGVGMIFGGIARLSAAFFADSFGSGALAFLWGLLVASTGFYMLTNPGAGLMTLTMVLSILFFVSGLSESVVAFHARPTKGWGIMLAGGMINVLLAFMIWRQFPLSGFWLVGTMVGINLLINGLSTLTVGTAAKRLTSANA